MTEMSSTVPAANSVKPVAPARRVVLMLALLLALPLAVASSTARAALPAETFIDQNVQKGLSILANQNLTDAQRRSQFRGFLLSLTDLNRIALFTLGPAKRTASDSEKAAFVDAFRDFAVAIYETRLSNYSGQTLKITGSTPTGRGDTIVQTTLIDPHSSDNQPLPVAFRVSTTDGKMVVIDVNVLGVWLAIEERDQFSSFLSEHANSVPALVAHLKELTLQIRNGGPLPGQQQQQ